LSIHAPTDYQQFYSENKEKTTDVSFQVGESLPSQVCFRNKRGKPMGLLGISNQEGFPTSAWITTVFKYKKELE
jgi:hypothetical protein